MTFTLLESKTEIAKAQSELERTIREDFKQKDTRNIGYPGGTKYGCEVFHNEAYWFHSDFSKEEDRRLNWFGLYRKTHGLDISVEVNNPLEGIMRSTAGFYARDNDTGQIFLMHSGRIAGGTPGVSKTNYESWTNQENITVIDSNGDDRTGFIVMPVNDPDAEYFAIRYVDDIAKFKQQVRAGLLNKQDFQQKQRDNEIFRAEARGERKALRKAELLYITRHGDVVDALLKWRKGRPVPQGGNVSNSKLIDLFLKLNGEYVEVYEVKTSVSRQYVYGAIGQLLVHGTSPTCKRFIVLPATVKIAKDLLATFERLNIQVIRFKLTKNSARIDP